MVVKLQSNCVTGRLDDRRGRRRPRNKILDRVAESCRRRKKTGETVADDEPKKTGDPWWPSSLGIRHRGKQVSVLEYNGYETLCMIFFNSFTMNSF